MPDIPLHRRGRAALAAFAALLSTMLLLAASWAPAGAQDEGPELTWAPLVTPPPLIEPPILSPTDQVDGFAMGAPDAPVTVEVWEDFQCPFCQRFAYEVKPPLVERYVESGEVRLVFRNLAFLGDESHWAAVAASLAADQNKFWPFHDYLFANFGGNESGSFHIDRLLEMGERVGLDMDEFRAGLTLENARQRFAELDAESRSEALAKGITATPTVTVDGEPLPAPDFGTVSDAIDIALARWRTANEADAEPSPEALGPPPPEDETE